MEIRKMRRETAVHLFGKWVVLLPSAQARFDVPNRNVMVVRSKCSREGSSRVALHKQQVWALLPKDTIEPGQARGCYIGKVLSWFHYAKIVVRPKTEDSQHLIEHLAVLPCDANLRLKVRLMFL
jgi:hypothetical protein